MTSNISNCNLSGYNTSIFKPIALKKNVYMNNIMDEIKHPMFNGFISKFCINNCYINNDSAFQAVTNLNYRKIPCNLNYYENHYPPCIVIYNNYINQSEGKTFETKKQPKINKKDDEQNLLSTNEGAENKSPVKRFKFIIEDKSGEKTKLNINDKIQFIGKKMRGRKPQKESKRRHNALDPDNILRKIQVHYLSFIINFSNDILRTIIPDEKDLHFKNINYSLKKIVNHSYIEELKSKKISEILQLNISPKNRKFIPEINKMIYIKVCEMNQFLKNFFDISYLDMFNQYYNYRKERVIDVGTYKVQITERTKLFIDLLKKNKNSEKKIEEIAEQFFALKKHDFNNVIFVINKDKEE